MNDTTATVPIPADVLDNSETVTDYAFMRHRSPDGGVRIPAERDKVLERLRSSRYAYLFHSWEDVNPDGQRCRFDMVSLPDHAVRYFFYTEYFTRVACEATTDDCPRWAQYYAGTTADGDTDEHVFPTCGQHAYDLRRWYPQGEGVTLRFSEPLIIGQH